MQMKSCLSLILQVNSELAADSLVSMQDAMKR